MNSAISCRSVAVRYGEVSALTDVSLEVAAGETLALLGPSGSGKTTLLHAIAGFLPLAGGEIHISGQPVSAPGRYVAPERRSVGMVFQNYALWPHLDAASTVAYPLRRAGLSRSAAGIAATDLLRKLDIGDLAARRPNELSGGQQQRVGLARALAREAAVYLFDEPTAHLDAAVRQSVAAEMALRQKETGAAAIYSSHDASEALAVADRIAILRAGRVVQVGTARDIYDEPADLWTARLTGPASFVDLGEGGAIVRADWVDMDGSLTGKVTEVWFRGSHTDYRITTSIGVVEVRLPGPPQAAISDERGWTVRKYFVPPST